MATSANTRTILVFLKDGKRRLVSNIPANAKITYGPISPGRGDFNSGNALRIYTSQQNQLAVFTDVKEFQDLSLTVENECVTQKIARSSAEEFSHCSLAPLVDLEQTLVSGTTARPLINNTP